MEEQRLLDFEAVHLRQQRANVERAARQWGYRLPDHHIAVEEFHPPLFTLSFDQAGGV